MEYTFAQYQESAQALRDRLGAFRPRCLLILGSGLGSLGNEVESPIAVPYEDVPPGGSGRGGDAGPPPHL